MAIPTREQLLEDIAMEGIGKGIGEEYESDDALYSDAYDLAFDALIEKNVLLEEARTIADKVARLFAQP